MKDFLPEMLSKVGVLDGAVMKQNKKRHAIARLPLWMGLEGSFKPVQASLFKRPGQGLGVAQARVQGG